MVNKEKACESANFQPLKQSDSKVLGADAKITIALLRKQPQKRLELCGNAGIDESAFSTKKRLLMNRKIIKESASGFSLWFFEENPTQWGTLVEQLRKVGGQVENFQIEKFNLGDYDKITGIPEIIYDKIVPTEGVLILRGATKLEEVLGLRIPQMFVAFLAAPVRLGEMDRFKWQQKTYTVKEVDPFYDGTKLSYSLAKLTGLKFSDEEIGLGSRRSS